MGFLSCLFGAFEDIAGGGTSSPMRGRAFGSGDSVRAGALVCRRPDGPRSAAEPLGAPAPARCGCARCSARSAAAPSGWSFRARAGERIRAHARALHGRRVSVPGEIRLRHGRPGRGRAAELRKAASSSRCIRIRPCSRAGRGRGAGARGRAAARGARRQHGDGAQRGLGRRAGPADRIAVVGGGLVGALVAYLCAACRPPRSRWSTSIRRARSSRKRSAPLLPSRTPRRPTATSSSTPAAPAAGLATALRLAGEEATIVELSWYGERRGRGAARRSVP